MNDQECVEHLFKILVVGDIATGKTSIIKRYVHNMFSQHYKSTIGVEFALKVISWDSKTEIRLQLWDIAGQERFGNMTRVYYREAVGAFVVFDVNRTPSFDAAAKWKADIDSKVRVGVEERPIPVVLLANKVDIAKEEWANLKPQMASFVKDNGFVGWYETSAKDNFGIDEAAKFLIEKILENVITEKQDDTNTIKLNEQRSAEKAPKEEGFGCCKM